MPTGAIDARYFETPYYLAPAKGGERAYALLRETMAKAAKTAVAQIVLRQAQHLGAITVVDDVLTFTTLRFAQEIANPRTLGLPNKTPLKPNELELAAKLVDGIAGDWKPEQYKDQYSENLLALIKAKTKKGAKPRLGELAPKPAGGGEVADLMEKLRASLAGRGATAKPARRAPAESKVARDRKIAGDRRKTTTPRHRRAA